MWPAQERALRSCHPGQARDVLPKPCPVFFGGPCLLPATETEVQATGTTDSETGLLLTYV